MAKFKAPLVVKARISQQSQKKSVQKSDAATKIFDRKFDGGGAQNR